MSLRIGDTLTPPNCSVHATVHSPRHFVLRPDNEEKRKSKLGRSITPASADAPTNAGEASLAPEAVSLIDGYKLQNLSKHLLRREGVQILDLRTQNL